MSHIIQEHSFGHIAAKNAKRLNIARCEENSCERSMLIDVGVDVENGKVPTKMSNED